MSVANIECKKCGAPVGSSDRFCPNGHDLNEVGRDFYLTLTEAITVSTKLASSSATTVSTVSEVKDSLETSTTLPPQARDEYSETMEKILNEVTRYKDYFEATEKLLRDIDSQTESKEGLDYWLEQIKSNVFGFVIGLILGWIIKLLT